MIPTCRGFSPNRRSVLKWSGAAGAGLLLGACGTDSATSPSFSRVSDQSNGKVTVDGPAVGLPLANDTEILKFALFLELLEAEFYKMAVRSDLLDDNVLDISTNVRDHEVCHVNYLHLS